MGRCKVLWFAGHKAIRMVKEWLVENSGGIPREFGPQMQMNGCDFASMNTKLLRATLSCIKLNMSSARCVQASGISLLDKRA